MPDPAQNDAALAAAIMDAARRPFVRVASCVAPDGDIWALSEMFIDTSALSLA